MTYNVQNPTSGYIEIELYVGDTVRLEYARVQSTGSNHVQYFYTYDN